MADDLYVDDTTLDLYDITGLVRAGSMTPEMMEAYLSVILTTEEFEPSAIAEPKLLRPHLERITLAEGSCVNSALCRCVEYGWLESARLLLEYLPKLEAMTSSLPISRILLLRWVGDWTVYHHVKTSGGFHDPMMEQRIVRLQRRIRRQGPLPAWKYTGPYPMQYGEPVVIPDGPTTMIPGVQVRPRYWGYRHTWYLLRHCPRAYPAVLHAVRVRGRWYSDCRHNAYLDITCGKSESPRRDRMEEVLDGPPVPQRFGPLDIDVTAQDRQDMLDLADKIANKATLSEKEKIRRAELQDLQYRVRHAASLHCPVPTTYEQRLSALLRTAECEKLLDMVNVQL